jgi:hypothetical protein
MAANDGDKVEIMSESTTLLCTAHIQPDQVAFPWLDFASQGSSTLLGAVLAFVFGWALYKKQKHEENKAYLHYMLSILCALKNHMYAFKEQVAQKRYEEYCQIMRQIETSIQNNQTPHIQMRDTANYMYGAEFMMPIDVEKLYFLTSREPNLIVLIGTLIDSVKSLNQITGDINNDIEKHGWQDGGAKSDRIFSTLEKSKILYEQLDSTIYLSEKAEKHLLQYGALEYKRKMKIQKPFEFTDDKYKALKPKPIASWEDGYEWFPKKKRWWNKSKT